MTRNINVYDKNGTLLQSGDLIIDYYDETMTIEAYWDEWYLASKTNIWKIEQFSLEAYKDGVLLVDFEKQREVKKC